MSVLEKNVTVLPSLLPSLIPTAFVIDAMALVQVMKSASFRLDKWRNSTEDTSLAC